LTSAGGEDTVERLPEFWVGVTVKPERRIGGATPLRSDENNMRRTKAATPVAADGEALPKATETIPYDEGVREGREIVARLGEVERGQQRDQQRLGELADKVEKKYGDRTLAKYAKDIGVAPCTLERHRSVYRAWKGIPAPGPVSYAAMRALQNHPDRAAIVKDNPNLTQSQARAQMRDHKEGTKGKSQDECQKNNKKWFK
jgi:hypothetical protein